MGDISVEGHEEKERDPHQIDEIGISYDGVVIHAEGDHHEDQPHKEPVELFYVKGSPLVYRLWLALYMFRIPMARSEAPSPEGPSRN
jgi:hypothetical protein